MDGRTGTADDVREADMICTCTPSAVPLFDGAWLPDGVHVNAIGAYTPVTRELDGVAMARGRVVVETRDVAMAEAGDLLLAIEDGAIGPEHVEADLQEAGAGQAGAAFAIRHHDLQVGRDGVRRPRDRARRRGRLVVNRTADVVIVGGGIVGCSAAYHLAAAGAGRVLLLERADAVGTGSTGRCAGGFRFQFSSEVNIRLSQASVPMILRFSEEHGLPLDVWQDGYLFLVRGEGTVAGVRRERGTAAWSRCGRPAPHAGTSRGDRARHLARGRDRCHVLP